MIELTDCAPLIEQVLTIAGDPARGFSHHDIDAGQEAHRISFRFKDEKIKKASVVTADEAALELGSPTHRTVSTLLWTKQSGLIGNSIRTSGRDFPAMKESPVSFAQVVMVELKSEFDPTGPNIQTISNLTNRIPGYMTRSIPGKIWIRIHRDLMAKGFSLYSLGQCLVQAYRESISGLRSIEVVLVADNPGLVECFVPIHNRSRVIYGENKKLALEADGTISCEDLNCEDCDEKSACDTIRDVIIKRRKAP
jgi:CO dehydrogenase/acetyl-CoA synthase beta subunit